MPVICAVKPMYTNGVYVAPTVYTTLDNTQFEVICYMHDSKYKTWALIIQTQYFYHSNQISSRTPSNHGITQTSQ